MVGGVDPVDVVAAVGVFGGVNMADPDEEKERSRRDQFECVVVGGIDTDRFGLALLGFYSLIRFESLHSPSTRVTTV
jgi:hypothetical protein